jgi:integrase
MSMTLLQLLDAHRNDHETGISDNTLACWYRPAISLYRTFLGHEPTLDDLNQTSFNRWIDSMREAERPMATIKSRRNAILTLWRYATEEDMVPAPRKVRKIKLTAKNPVAWSPEEVSQLINTALHGKYSHRLIFETQIPRGIYFGSMIATAWDTALRLGDLLRIKPSDIQRLENGEGRLLWIQHKTGHAIRCRISPETMELIDQCIAHEPERERVWPLWGSQRKGTWADKLYRFVRRLVKEAGISTGTMRYVRRGAVTEAENISPGLGTALAGNRSRSVTVANYIDQTKLRTSDIVLPSVVRPRANG